MQAFLPEFHLQVLGVFNPDFRTNSPSNPAPAGSVMTLYCSGAGQTVPPSQDGQINVVPRGALSSPVRIVPGPDPAGPDSLQVTFAGSAANLAAGIFQINFVAPLESATNINLVIGQAIAQFNAYVQK
jgi:uncharacterized protein (TIGR03437 family)